MGWRSMGCLLFILTPVFSLASDLLEGNWESGCAIEGSKIIRSELKFDGSNMVADYHRFNDSGCHRNLADARVEGAYSISGDSSVVPGAINIDLIIESATITPENPMAALMMNAVSLCGYHNWSSGVSKDVAGRYCRNEPHVPAKGNTMYYLLKLEDDSHFRTGFFSDDEDGSSVDKRPKTLDMALLFERDGSRPE